MIFTKIKEYLNIFLIGIVIILVLFGINKIQSCAGPKFGALTPTEIVQQNKTLSKVPLDLLKDIPANVKVFGAIVDKQTSQDPSKIIEITHIIHTDPNGDTNTVKYTDVIKIKNVYGFSFEPKFYLGYVSDGLTAGLGCSVLRLNKVTIDGLVSFPYVGLGTSYEITNNTFIGLAATAKYLNYKDIKDLSSYSVNLSPQSSILPLVYLGARF